MAEVREQERKSHEMGMHTEGLAGRNQQRFFKLEGEEERYASPSAFEVDFDKAAEVDAAELSPRCSAARVLRGRAGA